MTKRILSVILLLSISLLTFGCSNTGAEDAKYNCNDFYVYNTDGNKVQLYDIVSDGKPVIINYWTTWCPYCLIEMPEFNEVYLEYSDKVSFMMIDVDGGGNDDKSKAEAYVKDNGYSFPVYFDTDLTSSQANKIGSFPTTIIIDKDGNEIYNRSGTMSKESLVAFIEEALA